MILSFWTDRLLQTVWTQIRLLLKEQEQSNQGLHCLPFRLRLKDSLPYGRAKLFKLWDNYSNFSGVLILRKFMVI